jgi:hypothetical protein
MSVSEFGGAEQADPLNGRRILVIEDEYFLAEDNCTVLRGLSTGPGSVEVMHSSHSTQYSCDKGGFNSREN